MSHRIGGLVALLLVLAVPASAKMTNFTAMITGGQETPPNASTSFGVAFFTFDSVTDMLCFSSTTTPLASGEISSHIHGPAAVGVPGTIIFPLPLGDAKSACVGPLLSDHEKALKKSLLYINLHSASFPAGEIRGQILPSAK